jgi:hypothetical protein
MWGGSGGNYMRTGITSDGRIGFSSGTSPVDTYLQRSGVGELSIEGNKIITSVDLATKQNTLVSGTTIKTVNGESILGSGDMTVSAADSNPLQGTWIVEDFYDYNTTGSRVFVPTAILSGTAAIATTVKSDADHPGIARISSSTSANSGFRIMTATNTIQLKNGYKFRSVVRLRNITTGTSRLGFFSTNNALSPTNSAHFLISNGVATFVVNEMNATTTSAGSFSCSLDVWYEFRVEIDNSQAVGYIIAEDGTVLFASTRIGANCPLSTNTQVGCGVIHTNSGTTATEGILIDYIAMKTPPSTDAHRQAWD